MRVLITADCYLPVVNGVVTSILNLERELCLAGHEVKILTLSGSRESYTDGNKVYIGSINAGRIYPEARVGMALRNQHFEKLLEWKPEVVHSQSEFSTFLMARKIARILHIPLVHTYHTVYEDYTHYFSPVRSVGRAAVAAFSRKVLHASDQVIAPTKKVKTMLEGYGVQTKIHVIPSGIDMEHYKKRIVSEERLILRLDYGIPEHAFTAVFAGRLAKEKNLEEIIRMFASAGRRDCYLLIVGDGPQREALEACVRELGVEKQVIFTGMVPQKEVYRYYQMGDVFVSASTSETQGLTYIEALANGLPALCRKDPCLEGVIENGVNGWQYENEGMFLEKLEQFIQIKGTEAFSQMAEAAADGVYETFGAKRFAEHVMEVYTEACDLQKEYLKDQAM